MCTRMETTAPTRARLRRPVHGDSTSLRKPRRSNDRSNPVFLQNTPGVGFRSRQFADKRLAIGQRVGSAARGNRPQFGYWYTAGFDHIGLTLGDVLDQRTGLKM